MSMNRIDQKPGLGSVKSRGPHTKPIVVTHAAASQVIIPAANTQGADPDPDKFTIRPMMTTTSPTYPTLRDQTAIRQCRFDCN